MLEAVVEQAHRAAENWGRINIKNTLLNLVFIKELSVRPEIYRAVTRLLNGKHTMR